LAVVLRAFLVLVVAALASTLISTLGPAAIAQESDGVQAPQSFVARGSVEQVYVTGTEPGATVVLVGRAGKVADEAAADEAGTHLFRGVDPGAGYRVEVGDDRVASDPLRVLRADEHPAESFYTSQTLQPGYQYLTTRDGTQLAVNVTLPGPPEEGPYPTVIEYSGYDPANPDSNQAATRLAQTIGYATVGVNMRGTGCSGGAWQYFEPLQALDGYDAVEVVAAQPWVLHGRPGMVGISYPGISQLFVAATRPPHLAAITPMSVIADTYRGVLYPGGILNTGFAVPWAEDRQEDAEPAPDGGQRWARRRVEAGDTRCAANQALRGQTPDVLEEIERDAYHVPALDQVAPEELVDDIEVPTFLAGAWQDEQTGGYWPAMIDDFSPDVPLKVTMTNGTHSEPFGPDIITRWAEFLDLYVAKRVPMIPDDARANAALGYLALAGVPLELPPDRFADDTDYDTALERYESEPQVRVLFDNGAGGPAPGAPVSSFEQTFEAWPPSTGRTQTLYFGDDGTLSPRKPATKGVDEFRYAPGELPATSHPSEDDDFFDAEPDYDWRPLPADAGAAYTSPPLREDVVVLGPASADLWVHSSARDTDLEVVITEVRPDGRETYVQSGWLRASARELDDAESTKLAPVPTYTRDDASPLPRQGFAPVRVPLFPFGHVFRSDSRIRVVVQPPGGNRPRWAFDALDAAGPTTNAIEHSPGRPSGIVLNTVDVDVTTPLPDCGALRGQPCREYVATQTGS
jgi:hypothetical protein